MTVQPVSYSSDNYVNAVTNNTNSTMKDALDTWYKNNLINYTLYLADETFCNDRSVTGGSGYLTTPTTYYGAYSRLENNKTPSLKCIQNNDKFKVSNTSANLNYPVALITADEVTLAGGVDRIANINYYLHNGQKFWTLSPAIFSSRHSFSLIWNVSSNGEMYYWDDVSNKFGVRPVINLKADIKISSGDGTSIAPYAIKS